MILPEPKDPDEHATPLSGTPAGALSFPNGSGGDLVPAAAFLRACPAEAAGAALGLHQRVVAGTGACELTALLRPDLDGDPGEGQGQQSDAQQDGQQGGAHGAKVGSSRPRDRSPDADGRHAGDAASP